MDDLGIGVLPVEDEEELARARGAGIYQYAERTVSIAFEKRELYGLCELLKSVAVGDANYQRVAECVLFVEKIRARWTAAESAKRTRRRGGTNAKAS